MTATLSHMDTCLPDYLQDHCNGDHEMLLAVPVDGATTVEQVIDALADEFRSSSDERGAHITEDDFADILRRTFDGEFAPAIFDSRLEQSLETRRELARIELEDLEEQGEAEEEIEAARETVEQLDEEREGESCYAYFRLSWEADDDLVGFTDDDADVGGFTDERLDREIAFALPADDGFADSAAWIAKLLNERTRRQRG